MRISSYRWGVASFDTHDCQSNIFELLVGYSSSAGRKGTQGCIREYLGRFVLRLVVD